MPSPMETRLFFSSSTPTAMPLTYSTRSGRRSWLPVSVTSSAMAKSFFSGLVPVDEVDGLGDLARLDLHRHAVAQQAVDGLVVAVERAAVVVRLGAQLVEGDADLRRRVAALGQPGREQPLLDVAVAVAVGPVAEVAVAQLVAEQGDDAVLRGALGLADGAHTSRILPVSSSCIMPCLSWRALASFASSAAISAPCRRGWRRWRFVRQWR